MADEPDTLNADDAANFGGQPEGETPTGYIANFNGDEVDGKTYQMGDRLDASVDAGTIAYLVQNGRFTPTNAAEGGSPSGGEGGTGIPDGDKAPKPGAPDLSAEQQAEADKLVSDNSKDALLELAEDEGVEGVSADNNKAEIAAKIIAARSA